MHIELTDATRIEYQKTKLWLVEREARRFWSRWYVKTGVADFDDVFQEASKALMVSLEYFDRSKTPMAGMDAYLTLGIQGELKNWVAKTTRQFDITVDEPSWLENIPEGAQYALPSLDDLEIIEPLSTTAQQFLDCLFTPPEELKKTIAAKVTSGKPYSKSILPLILSWMKLTYDDFNAIRDELRQKCKYAPLADLCRS
jgi:DNA-directed RNA polymerase specialized sigma24 family protein